MTSSTAQLTTKNEGKNFPVKIGSGFKPLQKVPIKHVEMNFDNSQFDADGAVQQASILPGKIDTYSSVLPAGNGWIPGTYLEATRNGANDIKTKDPTSKLFFPTEYYLAADQNGDVYVTVSMITANFAANLGKLYYLVSLWT